MKLYLSHGGITRGRPEEHVWFIVEPRDESERLARELESLRRVGRTVLEIDTDQPSIAVRP